MVLRRNECGCLHVQGAAVLGTDLFSGARRLLLTMQYWEDSEFLWFHRFVCKKAQSFCELLFACFVPRSYSLSSLRAIPEQLGESPVCDVCYQDRSCLALLEISES